MRQYVRDGLLKQGEVSEILRAAYVNLANEEHNRRRLVEIQERTRSGVNTASSVADSRFGEGPA